MKRRIEIEGVRNGWVLSIGTLIDRSNPLGDTDGFDGVWVFTNLESVLEFIKGYVPQTQNGNPANKTDLVVRP